MAQAKLKADEIVKTAQREAKKTKHEADQYSQEVYTMANAYAEKVIRTTNDQRVKEQLSEILGLDNPSELIED